MSFLFEKAAGGGNINVFLAKILPIKTCMQQNVNRGLVWVTTHANIRIINRLTEAFMLPL